VENKCHRSEAGHTNGTDIPQQVAKNILAKPGASTHDDLCGGPSGTMIDDLGTPAVWSGVQAGHGKIVDPVGKDL
jgi:hypothetical protein